MSVPSSRLIDLIKDFAFQRRDLSFRGIFMPHERITRRLRIVRGLLKDVPKGTLTKATQKDIIAEIADTIRDSPLIKFFSEAEKERLRGLRGK